MQTIYNDIESCISVDGWLSESFKLQRGIRQGCPLSALLFITAAEFMTLNIENNDTIHGVMFENKPEMHIKIAQLADDTTIFVRNMTSVNNVMQEIERFSAVSGIRLNKQKTEGMWLGKNKPRNLNPDLKWTDNPVKCLGIYFGRDKKRVEDLNWNTKISKLQGVLKSWKARRLTYYGKLTIIKSIGISQILYNASSLHVPEYVIKKVNTEIFQFLWSSGREKVKRSTVISDTESGGLKMVNLKTQTQALNTTLKTKISIYYMPY